MVRVEMYSARLCDDSFHLLLVHDMGCGEVWQGFISVILQWDDLHMRFLSSVLEIEINYQAKRIVYIGALLNRLALL